MSLTKEQKRELERLSEHLKKIEKIAIENNIDLDVFMSQYNQEGFEMYTTERLGVKQKADKRREEFEKAGKEKNRSVKR